MKRGALVLCGGRSRRMGLDKATLPFGGETLLQRVVRRLAPVVGETVVVAGPDQALPPLPAGVRVARDDVPEQGPLAGIAAGLAVATADALYATGCDVPFLCPAVARRLFDRLEGHDAAVLVQDGFVHPLAAVYRRAVRPAAVRLLAAGRPRPLHLLEEVDALHVPTDEILDLDPALETLENLNTPEAYEAALARLRRETPS
ncbi:MAG: molybdenum cofactor guanylyltransferase [Planctomycetota bacterium]